MNIFHAVLIGTISILAIVPFLTTAAKGDSHTTTGHTHIPARVPASALAAVGLAVLGNLTPLVLAGALWVAIPMAATIAVLAVLAIALTRPSALTAATPDDPADTGIPYKDDRWACPLLLTGLAAFTVTITVWMLLAHTT